MIPLGDSALTVRVRAESELSPEECVRDVLAMLRRLQTAHLPGVLEVTPAFTTVSVFYDPVEVAAAGAPVDKICEWLSAKIVTLLEGKPFREGDTVQPRLIEIPVCYDAEFAPDLEGVASHANMSTADVVSTHSAATYRVGCIGFAPGFPYLSGLPGALATPRRATPRTQVAPGSVAIGGTQTGVYPRQSPGGWNVIGRTPRRLFDPTRQYPSLLAMGDAVRFRPITRGEFDSFQDERG